MLPADLSDAPFIFRITSHTYSVNDIQTETVSEDDDVKHHTHGQQDGAVLHILTILLVYRAASYSS